MQILKGVVGPHKDFSKSGKLRVQLTWPSKRDEMVEVFYTSPNYSTNYYGIFAPPPEHSLVLIAYDGKDYYYLSTVVDHSKHLGAVSKTEDGKFAPVYNETKFYTPSGQPAAMFFKNHRDAGLKITSYYAENEPTVNNVTLKSTTNHELVLSDSPDMDCVILRNKHGDGMTIGGEVTEYAPKKNIPIIERSITLKSLNSHRCVVDQGEYSVTIVDGRDITLRNESRGSNGFYVPDPTQIGPINPLKMYGNINLISKFRDINIYTDNPPPVAGGISPATVNVDSNIYISTNNQVPLQGMIQINANGDVKIFGRTGRVLIQSAGDIDLTSELGNVNIQALVGEVNIKSGTQTNIGATTTLNAYGLGETNLGAGTPLYLNKAGNSPSVDLPTVELPAFNAYGK